MPFGKAASRTHAEAETAQEGTDSLLLRVGESLSILLLTRFGYLSTSRAPSSRPGPARLRRTLLLRPPVRRAGPTSHCRHRCSTPARVRQRRAARGARGDAGGGAHRRRAARSRSASRPARCCHARPCALRRPRRRSQSRAAWGASCSCAWRGGSQAASGQDRGEGSAPARLGGEAGVGAAVGVCAGVGAVVGTASGARESMVKVSECKKRS